MHASYRSVARICARVLATISTAAAQTLAQEAAHQPLLAAADKVDWHSSLSRFDLRWDRMPRRWEEGPFLGNGEQGTQIYQTGAKVVRFDTGCSAAHDHRPVDQDDLAEKHVEVLNRGRHFVGYLELRTSAPIASGTARQELWNAEATGVLRSATGGELRWRCLVHAAEPVTMIETQATGDLADSTLHYVALPARSPRAVRSKSTRQPENPASVRTNKPNSVEVVVQDLASGGQTAVACVRSSSRSSGVDLQTLFLSALHSYPARTAATLAAKAATRAAKTPRQAWVGAHQSWWHAYYPQSYLSTGDAYWDAFYWIQQFKLAAATRDKGWIIDNQGPWLQPTAWSATWWNLNAQTSHVGAYQANRRGQVSALSHRLDLHRDNLARNVAAEFRHDSYGLGRSSSGWDLLAHSGQPGGRAPIDKRIGHETGNLLWALHNVDLEHLYWADKQLRDKVLYPLLVRAVNYFRHFLRKGADGLLHLPPTHSPEYRTVADCSYDLDLLQWGLQRLIALAKEKQREDSSFEEPLLPTWRALSTQLTPVHVDDTGRMIGRGVPLKGGHRHWSHLLAVYPLRTLTPETSKGRELIDKSLTHWRSFGRTIAGYSSTASACMAAMLGDGDRAYGYLNALKRYLRPNTLYAEAGNPVMETPLHGATAMQEMVLQSWGGKLRVFPAAPTAWPDVQFARFRAEGGFLVSARRARGSTQWVEVFAENGGTIEVDCGNAIVRTATDPDVRATIHKDGTATLRLQPGSRAQLFPAGSASVAPAIETIPLREPAHAFGLRPRKR
ncbi:MAG: glycoside hydrolase family 95-like protein [Planctomycetota bacterium]